MLWNFLLILLLVALNGFFVATEFAVITARKTRASVCRLKREKPSCWLVEFNCR